MMCRDRFWDGFPGGVLVQCPHCPSRRSKLRLLLRAGCLGALHAEGCFIPLFSRCRAFLFPYAGLPEDGLVRELLELLPQQERVERDLVVRDPAHAELVEELSSGLAVFPDEQVVRAPVAESRARVAVDVRHDEVHPVLREGVERDALDEHPADLLVHALDVRLLRGAVRVREPDPDAARLDARGVVVRVGAPVLDHVRVAELRAVVGVHGPEERDEQRRPRDAPQHVEQARRGLRGPPVSEEREREARGREYHRVEDLPADGPDDGVELARHDADMLLEPLPHLADGPSHAALGVGLRLLRRPRPGAARAGEGLVVPLRAEQSPVDPVVDRAHLRLPERAGVVRDDVAAGLPLADAGRQDRVHRRDGLRAHAHAEAAVDERALVVGLGAGGEVVLLAHRAVALGRAPVADVRGLREARAVRLEEVRARPEAARLVLPQPLAEAGELLAHALVEARAEPVGASVALVAVDAPGDDLAHHRGVGPSDLLCDPRDLHSASEQELDAFPFVDSHVLCHGSSPCPLFADRRQGRPPLSRRPDGGDDAPSRN